MTSNIFAGTIPALMTPCKPDRTPDFGALVRKGRELIAAGMSAVVYCGSMGDWPLLTDEQRMEGVERLVEAGIPVIVGTGAQNSKRAAAFAAHAKRIGARGLMIIPAFCRAAPRRRRSTLISPVFSTPPSICPPSSTTALITALKPAPNYSPNCAAAIPISSASRNSAAPTR
jgi:hypothetical protein